MNMMTQKQFDANKANSLFGGVKTDEGKETSRMNALKHGLLSSHVLLDDESEEELATLENNIKAQLLPVGEFELILTDRITSSIWRLKRSIKIESSLMEYEHNDFDMYDQEFSNAKQKKRNQHAKLIKNDLTERLMRYETSIERGMFRALHELQRMQAVRNGEKISAPMAIDVDIKSKE